MKPIEIIEKIKAENPAVLGKMNDAAAAKVVKLALAELAKQVEAAEEGVVKVMGLGNFRVKNIEKEVDGAKVATKKIFFVPAKPVSEEVMQERQAKKTAKKETPKAKAAAKS